MREHKLVAPDVDLAELAIQTENFTGAEIEGLVRAAQSTAMNRFIQVLQAISYAVRFNPQNYKVMLNSAVGRMGLEVIQVPEF